METEPDVILNDPGDKEKNFNRRNFRVGDGDSEQFSGALNFDTPIGKGLELYSFADVSRRENESGGFYRQPRNSGNPVGSGYPDGFLPLINTTIWDFSFGAGLVKEFDNGLKADLGVVHGGNMFNFNITNSHNASWVTAKKRPTWSNFRKLRRPGTLPHHSEPGFLPAGAGKEHEPGLGSGIQEGQLPDRSRRRILV